MPSVLVVLAEGFEEIEAITPIDLLRRAGVQVTTASITDQTHVTGRSGITLHADTTLDVVQSHQFDCVVLPGGPAAKHLREAVPVRAVLAKHNMAKCWIAAICAAPLVLHDIGLLLGRRFTAHPSTSIELTQLLPSERVVVDANIITSRGAGTALDFGLMLVEKLVSPESAREVAHSICA